MATTAAGYGVRLLLGGAAVLRSVTGEPLDPLVASSSSRVPCRLLLEAQGASTEVESFVPSKVARFLLRRGQLGRGADANGLSLLGCLADSGLQKTTQIVATIDIKLPRRSLLVQFTCNACGERTKRLINRVAYERGTVFLQCAGCQVYHKFVDNLGLVIEYDLREENELLGENVVNTNPED